METEWREEKRRRRGGGVRVGLGRKRAVEARKNKQRINRSKERGEKNRLRGRERHGGLEANSA